MHLRRARQFLLLLFALALTFLVAPARASQSGAQSITMSVSVGFDGFYKSAFWTPVNVAIANDGPAVEGHLQIVVGGSASRDQVIYTAPVSLPTQSSKRLTLYVFLPNLISRLEVELIDDRDQVVTTAQSNILNRLETYDLIYGVVSPVPGELDFLEDVTGGRSNAAAAFIDLTALPEVPAAWSALDILILHDVDTGRLEPPQMEALIAWVESGGQMVVAGGPGWRKSTAAFSDLLPVAPIDTQTLQDLPALSAEIGIPFRDPGPYVFTSSTLRNGELLFHQDGLPLLAVREYGRGSIYFLALDPGLAPLLDWDGSEALWDEVAFAAPRLPGWAIGGQNSYAAANAISSLPSLALPSVLQLFAFLFIYVFVVGPLNYILLKRSKRRELAWFTIPGLVLFFTILAYVTGFRLKGNDTIVNQMSVVFGPIDGQNLRVESFLGLYSPGRSTYALTLPDDSMVRPFDGDIGSFSGSNNVGPVQRGSEVEVSPIRVDVSDVQGFVIDTYTEAPALEGEVILRLDERGFKLEARLQNNTDFTLENAAVIIGLTAISIGDLEPGQNATVIETISSGQAFATSGSTVGAPVRTGPIPGGGSPLALNYDIILGTSNYFNDREAFPRWQLLQAIVPEFGSSAGNYPRGTATLVGWSKQNQIEVGLEDKEFGNLATTLYFLELPLTQTIVSGSGVTIPESLLEWQVLAESGVFEPTISNLYMPPGWVVFEFRPWPEFRDMTVTDLELSLTHPSGVPQGSFPRVMFWDWSQEAWITLSGLAWGQSALEPFAPYLGPGNTVRMRLENDGPLAIEIEGVHPILKGDL